MTQLDVPWLQESVSVEKWQNDMRLLIHLLVLTDSGRFLLIRVLKLDIFYLFTYLLIRLLRPVTHTKWSIMTRIDVLWFLGPPRVDFRAKE